MGLLVMILGLVLFLGIHTLTTQRQLRARCITSMGEGGYKIFYSLASVAGLALITWGLPSIARLAGSMSGIRRRRSSISPWR